MERLTERWGEDDVWVKDHDYVSAAHRLAAYEDTGLEPEEVHSMQGEWSAMMAALNSMGGGYTRLRELAEADKDGRLLVLPKGGRKQ